MSFNYLNVHILLTVPKACHVSAASLNTGAMRNDREDNSTRTLGKATYRQFILACYGYLGKENQSVCPSCVVLKIPEKFPSVTDIYMAT